jgi:BirA family biotin operon repressor/biotin-[acetyl-CoA-carboxylase] ligase
MIDERIVLDGGVCEDGVRACVELIAAGDCRSVRYFAEIDSTNSAACRDLAGGAFAEADQLPRLYLADLQTGGRGRHGRKWVADQGTLTFSVLYGVGSGLDLDGSRVPMVALATGVAIARTIEYLAAPIVAKIKWPNDVHVAGGKAAGVLVESVANRIDRLVVGVGLNVATKVQRFEGLISQPARSINDLARGPASRYQWLGELVNQMGDAFRQLGADPQPIVDELRDRCLLAGTLVRYQLGDAALSGRCLGVDRDGALLVQTESGIRAIQSGEVTQIRQ